MRAEELANSKIVIFSHYATTGACEELRDWLRQVGVRELVYVAFPFGPNRDRFIRVQRHVGGRALDERRSLFRLKLPEPLAYLKDLAYAVLYAVRYGRGADALVAGDSLLALGGVLARRLARLRRVVYYMIDYTPVRYANRLLNAAYYAVDRMAAYGSDAVWPLTEEIIKGRFDAGRLNPARVQWAVVPYGSHPVRRDGPRPQPARQVVYMGDVVRNKGAELLVPMALELRKRVPGARLTVIGGGKDLAALRDEVARAGLGGSVELCGFVADMAEVVATLAQGSVAIAPYYPHDKNSFTFYSDPGKVKVYLGCGLPIVITDVPPIARALERQGAGKVAAYDAADFAEKIAALLTSPDYEACCERSRQLGLQYAWEKVFRGAFERLGPA